MPPGHSVWGLFSWWRHRTRTAAEATAACGGNREPRLGQRSDFSKPCQGAAEKSANATRTGASRQIPSRFPTPRNVYRDDRRFVVGGTGREPERAKAGYHHDGGILPFALHPLYCTFRVNRCVRPYMAGTHVRRKKGRFLHIGVFFRLSVWYTRFSSTNRNLQDGETYGRIDTKMFMGNYRLI